VARPFACFAELCARWTSVRKVKEGEVTADLLGFLTVNPNAEVGTIHPVPLGRLVGRSLMLSGRATPLGATTIHLCL